VVDAQVVRQKVVCMGIRQSVGCVCSW